MFRFFMIRLQYKTFRLIHVQNHIITETALLTRCTKLACLHMIHNNKYRLYPITRRVFKHKILVLLDDLIIVLLLRTMYNFIKQRYIYNVCRMSMYFMSLQYLCIYAVCRSVGTIAYSKKLKPKVVIHTLILCFSSSRSFQCSRHQV